METNDSEPQLTEDLREDEKDLIHECGSQKVIVKRVSQRDVVVTAA